MSRSLRYKNSIICNHLASQYVVGVMTPNVRSRVEVLRLTFSELDDAIINWAEKLSSIQESLPERTPPVDTWNKIESALFEPVIMPASEFSLWKSLRFWQYTGIGASFASMALFIMLFISPFAPIKPPVLVSATPSYMAVMSPFSEEKNITESNIRFVVNVYQKTDSSPSRLFIQWSERQSRSIDTAMHLWAKDRDTGKVNYIGIEPRGDLPWNLNKSTWQAISNSSELFFTRTENIPSKQNMLFSGPCIQLGGWKQNLT